MPSNLSGFYMPYSNVGTEDQERYDYDIDITNDKRTINEESKVYKKPPTRKSMIAEKEEEEDNIAIPIEEYKSGSWSPMIRQRSVEKRGENLNSSGLQRSSIKYKKSKNTPSVPAPQLYQNYDPRSQDPGRIINVRNTKCNKN